MKAPSSRVRPFTPWQQRTGSALLALALAVLGSAVTDIARAEQSGDIAAFLLGLRDERVYSAGEARIPLNEVWGFAEATRIGPGRYRAVHKGGVLKLEAAATEPEKCVHKVEFTFRTAGLIDSKEVWTLDLRSSALAIERKTTGVIKGIALRVRGKNAFCYTSTLRADSCVDDQLFDDHTIWSSEADLERKQLELEGLLTRLKSGGCGQ